MKAVVLCRQFSASDHLSSVWGSYGSVGGKPSMRNGLRNFSYISQIETMPSVGGWSKITYLIFPVNRVNKVMSLFSYCI